MIDSALARPVLVTGAAGFIGSQVCELLLGSGHAVLGIDNLNDAYDVRLKQWRLARLTGHRGFVFARADIGRRDEVDEIFANAPRGVEAVVNLAARAGVRQSIENPRVYVETNVTGTMNLLEACHAAGVPKFVLASTSSVYGDSTPRPFCEDAATDRPLSPYAASKKAAEALCYAYHSLYDIDISVLRYFTVYGPAGRPDMSPFRFVQWVFEEREVTLYGDGSQERDFTYVEDIARGTIAALRPVGYETVNLGSDRPVRLLELLRTVERLVGKTARIRALPAHPADVSATWADIGKAGRLLDWRPRTSLEGGLERLVDWYRANRSWAKEIVP